MASPQHATAPGAGFALVFGGSEGACSRCAGLPTLKVINDAGVTIGYVVADWPWDTDISDDPSEHPNDPHYVVEWFGQDDEHRELPGIRAEDPYFIALAVHEQHQDRAHSAV